MIFATVGTQLPFDRLLGALDSWAGGQHRTSVFAQTGRSGSDFHNLECTPFMAPSMFRDAVERARVIVGHAGMGTILTAAELGKPVIIMPRRAAFGEHRNDHQLATASEMRKLPNVLVAEDETQLSEALGLAMSETSGHGGCISPYASPDLLSAVSDFIRGGHVE
ncbi:MAG: glycosyltransferase family 28 protein [Pelagimonas sp.]